ncbi:cytochrome c3 family protein [Trichloromonas sp.]|uniref:cytochrome c3 family protein n=1 Tax=Trichloromonas sp. TaxID=3069249 RepID=UPI003D816ACA
MTRRVLLTIVLLLAAGTQVWAAGFNHNDHVNEYVDGAGCDTCHVAGAESIVPDTAVCLECHDEELIGSLSLPEPRTHGPVWALNHRAEAKGSAIDCAMCHEQSYCLDCHKAGFAHEQGAFGNNMSNVHRSDFHVTHPLAARSDQNLCSSCHEPDSCTECHDRFRLRGDGIGSPSHRRTFDLGFNTSMDDHPTNSTQCDDCHLQTSVAPSFHDWEIGHAREARRSLSTCQACHPDGDVCLKCHSARSGIVPRFNPHGNDWSDRKGRLKDASNGKTCRRCHAPGTY